MVTEKSCVASSTSGWSVDEKTDRNHDEVEEQPVVQEEDWSEFMNNGMTFESNLVNNSIHDDVDSNFFGFSSHDDRRQIFLPTFASSSSSSSSSVPSSVTICCASSLSPMDMVNMSYGADDATGHVIWMGARLLIEALPYPLSSKTTDTSVRDQYLHQKCIIELGCGTGLAGIAAIQACRPTLAVLTDGNEAALNLVKHNFLIVDLIH